jgi:hypothetical protein
MSWAGTPRRARRGSGMAGSWGRARTAAGAPHRIFSGESPTCSRCTSPASAACSRSGVVRPMGLRPSVGAGLAWKMRIRQSLSCWWYPPPPPWQCTDAVQTAVPLLLEPFPPHPFSTPHTPHPFQIAVTQHSDHVSINRKAPPSPKQITLLLLEMCLKCQNVLSIILSMS